MPHTALDTYGCARVCTCLCVFVCVYVLCVCTWRLQVSLQYYSSGAIHLVLEVGTLIDLKHFNLSRVAAQRISKVCLF